MVPTGPTIIKKHLEAETLILDSNMHPLASLLGSFAKKEGIWSIGHFGVIGTMRYSISKCTFLFNKPGGLACLSRIKPGSKNLIPAYLRDKKLFCKTKTFKRRDSTPICSKAGIVSF